jgi:hypothetical protein
LSCSVIISLSLPDAALSSVGRNRYEKIFVHSYQEIALDQLAQDVARQHDLAQRRPLGRPRRLCRQRFIRLALADRTLQKGNAVFRGQLVGEFLN